MSEKPQALKDEWKNQSLRMAEKAMRDIIIEECARVAESWLTYNSMAADIAAAIRALKDKSCPKD